MSEFQLSVPYKTRGTRAALVTALLMLPVWSLIAPVLLGFFIGWLVNFPGGASPFIVQLITFVLLGTSILGFFLSALAEENKIYATKNGLSFPPFMLPYLRFKRDWSWEEIATIDVTANGDDSMLIVQMKSGPVVALSINAMNARNTEELLLAAELWAKCERSPALIAYQEQLQSENKGLEHLSYTEMWEDELRRRFSATTFVPLEPGKTLQDGSLKIVRQLAFGGLSAIYLAQKNETDMYVLKEAVVPPNADEEARKAAENHLARESKMLFNLRHPNIARVLDHFVEDGRHYLLMEYVLGQDLRQNIMQNGPRDEQTVRKWCLEMAEILHYLHGRTPPIIHRDMTPDNIVLRNDGSLVLIDFGASNEFVGTATGTLVGKQAYMAPEQLQGKAVPQSDLYALGCTLYFLLVGRDPLPLSQIELEPILPDVSPLLIDLVRNLTAMERAERIQTAQEVLEILTSEESCNSAAVT